MHRARLYLAAALGLVLLLAACGNDEAARPAAQEPTPEETEVSAEAARLCAKTEELDRAGTEYFKKLQADEDATKKDYAKAEKDFYEEFRADIQALVEAAPDEIRKDVEVLMGSLRQRAGAGPKVDPEKAAAAQQAFGEYIQQNC